jgi:PKD repeat protein
MTIRTGVGNAYNTTKKAGTNIVGGPYIGGNFWGKPDSTGFSQTAVDKNGDGISDSVYKSITGSRLSDYFPLVIPKPPAPVLPVAKFSSNNTSGNVPLNVAFTDTSTGTPTKWNWNFGDGTYSTVHNPVHTYSAAGNYAVTLTVSNAAGSNTTTKSNYIKVTLPVQIPVVSFWGSRTSGNVPLTLTFTDASTGSPTEWNWNFGDGTYSTVQNPRHIYSEAGNYTVTLTASNEAGSGTKARPEYIKVTVPIQKPVSDFSSNVTSGITPLNVAFTDKSTGKPTEWNWSFGDGIYSPVKNPEHAYSKEGNYTVSLTVKNTAGSNTTTKSNYIKATLPVQKPVVSFWGSRTSGTAPITIGFTDASTGSPTFWKWSFGDGTYSTVQNPRHIYSKAGTYSVTLTASNVAGTGTNTRSNYIKIS